MKMKRLCISLICMLFLLVGCDGQAPNTNTANTTNQQANIVSTETVVPAGLSIAKVERVVDGDTLEVSIDEESYKVRLILVDTPESVHPDESRNNEYGELASAYTASQLKTGQTIYLQKDVSETDKYGRLLRYVWLEQPTDVDSETEVRAKMYNARLLLEGYAQLSTYPPDVKYVEMFTGFQKEARESDKGLWGIQASEPAASTSAPAQSPATATTATPSTTAPTTVEPVQQPQTDNQSVTVYVTKTGSKYHSDGCRYLSKSKIPMSLSDAKRSYGPCSVCNPPR